MNSQFAVSNENNNNNISTDNLCPENGTNIELNCDILIKVEENESIKDEIKFEEKEFEGVLDYGMDLNSPPDKIDEGRDINTDDPNVKSSSGKSNEDLTEIVNAESENKLVVVPATMLASKGNSLSENKEVVYAEMLKDANDSKCIKAKIKAPKNFYCNKCEFKSSLKTDLKRHVDAVHLKLKPYGCENCNYKASNKNLLKLHIMKVHLKENNFKCVICEERFSTKAHMKRHTFNVHFEDKIFNCALCNFKTNLEWNFKCHMKNVHSNTFQCQECKFRCDSRNELKIHSYKHTTKQLFKCSRCKHLASNKFNLKVHIQTIHENLKSFHCSKCEYKTNRKDTLKKHYKIHDKIKD